MDIDKKQELLADINPNILTVDGHDNALIGYVEVFNKAIAVYDKDLVIKNLEKDMTYEEALEYFDFNIKGAYMGETTPAFLTTFNSLEK